MHHVRNPSEMNPNDLAFLHRNMNSSNYWYANECFSKYWQHYHDVKRWYLNHLYYQNSMNHSNGFNPSNTHVEPWNEMPQIKRWKKRKNRKHKKIPKQPCKSFSQMEQTETLFDLKEQEEVEEEFELEITESMREFIANSNELKKIKGNKKIEENFENEQQKCINIEELADQPREASHLPPSERPGVRRTHQMKQLYGKKADLIHAMETALQMEFDRMIDVDQPKLWPNMPLKCIFY